MTLKEQLAEKKSALFDLKEAIEADNAEAIASGEKLDGEIKDLEAQIGQAEKKAALLGRIGKKTKNETEEKTAMQKLAAKANGVDKNLKGWSVSEELKRKAAAATDTILGARVADIDRSPVQMVKKPAVADLFGALEISGNALTYFTRGAWLGTPAVVAEGAKKSQLSTQFTSHTTPLSKIAGYVKETDEILNDNPFLASVIQNDLMYELDGIEDSTIMTSVLGTSGLQVATYGTGGSAATLVEAILYAKGLVGRNTPFQADFVAINPSDMYNLLIAKDANNQYLGGGYFQGAYGNGEYASPARIWGLPIFETSTIAAGTVLVGAGQQSIKIARKGGITVNIYEQNEDDAINNRVTLLAEERLAVIPKYPAGLCKITAVPATPPEG